MIKHLGYSLDFGKHRGFTLEALLTLDPSYVVWAATKTFRLPLSTELLAKFQKATIGLQEEEIKGHKVHKVLTDEVEYKDPISWDEEF